MILTETILNQYNAIRPEKSKQMVCWSPVKNLFFGMRGKVMTCCYNKSYLLGEYPNNSLKEIWFGEKRKSLINTLQKNNFSLGCQGCYETINARNFNGLTALKFDYLPEPKHEYPTRIDFELSNECNLECTMCRGEFSTAIRRNREKLHPIHSPYDTNFLKELEAFIPHLTECHFLGGEPFMIPIYLDIWDLIIKLNPEIRISIVTNGTTLSNRIKGILEKLSCDVCVSIDSANKATYEGIRKNAIYEKVIENVAYLRNYTKQKGTRFNISACALTTNAFELADLVKFANSFNSPIFFTRVTYPRELSIEALPNGVIEQIISTLKKVELRNITEIEKKNNETLTDLLAHFEFWLEHNKIDNFTKPSSIADYFSGLNRYLQLQNEEEKFIDIITKLNYIIDNSNENKRDSVEQKIIEIPYKTQLKMLPGLSKEHLLHLFGTFVIPIEE